MRDIGGYIVALKWTMSTIYDVKPGETYLVRLRHRLGGRPFLHRLRAASARLRDRPLRGQADRDARRRGVLAGDRGIQGRAPSSPRRRLSARCARRTRRPRCSRTYDIALDAHAVPRRRARRSRTPSRGPKRFSACRWSITGGRPRPAGRSPPIRSASAFCRSSPARRPCRCPATLVEIVDEACHPLPVGNDGLDRDQAAAAAGLPADALSAGRADAATATSRNSPAITRPPTPASSTRTAISPSSAAPTTSSTSPAIACRPAAWRKWSPRIRTSPNAPCSASRTRSRASSLAASSC